MIDCNAICKAFGLLYPDGLFRSAMIFSTAFSLAFSSVSIRLRISALPFAAELIATAPNAPPSFAPKVVTKIFVNTFLDSKPVVTLKFVLS